MKTSYGLRIPFHVAVFGALLFSAFIVMNVSAQITPTTPPPGGKKSLEVERCEMDCNTQEMNERHACEDTMWDKVEDCHDAADSCIDACPWYDFVLLTCYSSCTQKEHACLMSAYGEADVCRTQATAKEMQCIMGCNNNL